MNLQAEKIELAKRLLETEDESVLLQIKRFLKAMTRISGTIFLNM